MTLVRYWRVRSRLGATAVAVVIVVVAGCGGARTDVRTMAPVTAAEDASWFLTFRYDVAGAVIENVPMDDGSTGRVEWSPRSEAELLFRNELAYILSVEHGVDLAESKELATGVLAISVQLTTGGRGLLDMGDWIRRADVYVMDRQGTTTYAQVTVEDNPLDRQSPEELAEVAARLIADLLRR